MKTEDGSPNQRNSADFNLRTSARTKNIIIGQKATRERIGVTEDGGEFGCPFHSPPVAGLRNVFQQSSLPDFQVY